MKIAEILRVSKIFQDRHLVLKNWKFRVIPFTGEHRWDYAYTQWENKLIAFNKLFIKRYTYALLLNIIKHEIAHVYSFKESYRTAADTHGRDWYMSAQSLTWTLAEELPVHQALAVPKYQKHFKSFPAFLKRVRDYYYVPSPIRQKYGVLKTK